MVKRKFTPLDGESNDKRDRRKYNSNIGNILANHRGAGVKTLKLDFYGPPDNTKSYNRLSSWLKMLLHKSWKNLPFHCCQTSQIRLPLLTFICMSGNTIRCLSLDHCAFHPTVYLRLRCLTELKLYEVHITGGELGRLLSSSFALEKLSLTPVMI